MSNKVFLTGIAGFIGYHTALRLLSEGYTVVGLDNINDYYNVKLKEDRLKELGLTSTDTLTQSNKYPKLSFIKADLNNKEFLLKLFGDEKFDCVINLAAQAGVRYSFTNPDSYIDRNIIGFFNILEACRFNPVNHLIYASSSSVYGLNKEVPFSVEDNVDHPISLYAATKKSNELMAHVYSYLFNISTTGLRFFTVYGPWGRPDMMMHSIAKSITEGSELQLYNGGELWRDFTYVDDIVESLFRLITKPPVKNEEWKGEVSTSISPYRVLNIGHGSPVKNLDLINLMEKEFGKKANSKVVEAPKTEVFKTFADTKELEEITGYKPKVSIEEGVKKYVEWYGSYYRSIKN